jgi:hypothetical protein
LPRGADRGHTRRYRHSARSTGSSRFAKDKSDAVPHYRDLSSSRSGQDRMPKTD